MRRLPPAPHYRLIQSAGSIRVEHLDVFMLALPERAGSEFYRRWCEIDDPVVADGFVYGALSMYIALTHEKSGTTIWIDDPRRPGTVVHRELTHRDHAVFMDRR